MPGETAVNWTVCFRQLDEGKFTLGRYPQGERVSFSHFRDKDQLEVDVVLESGGRVAGVEVKAAATVTNDDFKGLRKLQQATGNAFAAGVLLYDGDAVVGFGDRLYAVPVTRLWEDA